MPDIVSCTLSDLDQQVGCLLNQCLGEKVLQAIDVVLLNYLIAGLTSSTLLSTTELMELNACYKCRGKDHLHAIRTYVLWQIALAYGNRDTPAAVGTLINEISCLACTNVDLEPLLTALLCRAANALENINAQPT